MGVTVHYFVHNALVFDINCTITPQSPRKFCYFGGFKSVSSKITTGAIIVSDVQSNIFKDYILKML